MERMNKDQIKHFLPHREPMLLIDEAWVDEDGTGHATYRIKEDEFFTRGHFPGNPIVPGVILCEIMAQSGAITIKDELAGKATLYRGIDNVKFKNPVRPGDLCEITTRQVGQKGFIYTYEGKLEVAGQLCAKGTMTFALIPLEK